jgi:nicotinamidase-related amidase
VTRHPGLLARDDSILLLVDVQERLLPIIRDAAAVEANLVRLARGARLLSVPLLVSEQYPKGLGPTVPALRTAAGDAPVIQKTTFSCGAEPALVQAIRALDRGTVVVAGIEAHICVLQTALDLLARGFGVHVAADATGTRLEPNLRIGHDRAARAGAVITSVESVLFEWMGRSDIPEFKQVQALLKAPGPEGP